MRTLLPLSVSTALILAACNAPPSAPEVAVSPEAPTTLDNLVARLATEASDPNDDLIGYGYVWTRNGEAVTEIDGDTVPASRTAKGEVWEVYVVATDGSERVESAVIGTTIVNSPPEVTARPLDPAPRADQPLTVEVEVEDADADEVTLTYVWSLDGQATDHDGPTVPAEDTNGGEQWEVVITPNDGETDGEPQVVAFSVENRQPLVVEATLTPTEPTEGDTITLTYDTEDPDGQDVEVDIVWTVDGREVTGATGTTLSGADFDKGQIVAAEITPTDGFLEGRTVRSNTVQVFNTPPSATGASLDTTTADESTVIGCSGSGYADADGDPEGWQYEWLVDGEVRTTTPTIDGAGFDKGQTVVCRAYPFDGEERGEPVNSSGVTIDNSAPTVASAAISNTSPRVGDTLTVVPTGAVDPDGDPVTLEIAWQINGSSAGTGATLSSGFKRGDSITATITPSDSRATGSPVSTPAVTVVNSPPSLTMAFLTPSTIYTDSTVTPSYTGVDADGDSVTASVAWSVNGTGVGSTLSPSAFEKGDVLVATLTPTDGTDTGTALSTPPVTVQNKPPTAPTIALSDLTPDAGVDDLVCRVTRASTDPDGDGITYTATWTEDGSSFGSTSSTTFTGDTIDRDDLDAGKAYVCSVKASDGTALSSAATSPTARPGGISSPGDIASVSSPTVRRSGRSTWGAWFRDGKSPGNYYAMQGYSGQTSLEEYTSLSNLAAGRINRTIRLPVGWDGTGATLWDGQLYYNETNTRNIVRVDLSTNRLMARRTLPNSAYYRNQAAYQWGGYSDIDMAADETGLYVIYATPSSSRRIVISKVDPSTLAITRSWTTGRDKRAGNSWMIGGKLYVTNSYSSRSTTIDYIYDTATSRASTASIAFTNPHGYNSMIDYNAKERLLYSWDSGRLQTYSLTFK